MPNRNLSRHLSNFKKMLDELPSDASKVFVEETPVRTGNARRKTDLRKTEITADYSYANSLNKGHSRQAPQGMTDPTVDFMRDKVRKVS